MKIINLIKKYLRNILVTFNIIFSLFLLLSYLSAYISPESYSVFAFFGLVYSFLLIINLIFLFYFIITKSKLFLISAITIGIGWSFLMSFAQINFNSQSIDSKRPIFNILSFNVRVFDLWNWSGDKNRATQTYDFIKNSKANIVCLQEYYSSHIKGKNSKDSLMKDSILKYEHISFTHRNNKTYNQGIATFSTFPIVNKGSIQSNDNDNFCIYSDVKIEKDTVRVYNLHLESIHLGYEDYRLLENLNNEDIQNVNRIKKIILKVKRGFEIRARQTDLIITNIEKCPYRILLCGDFNDPPISYVYNKLTEKLIDSFCESGNGIGSTYINKYSTFRIDYIMHSSEIITNIFSTLHVELSDHYPVVCNFQIVSKFN